MVAVCAIALLAMLAVPTGVHGQGTLEPLGSFETFDSLGFSPDGVTYRAKMAHLLIASASGGAGGETGVFETTLDGDLLGQVPFPDGVVDGTLGFSITTATSGSRVGHVFLAAYEGPPTGQTVSVIEFDRAWNVVADFEVTGVDPGDGITWNHRSQTLVVADVGASLLIEVTPDGEPVRTVPTLACMAGVTFNIPTGTYFGVCHTDATMWEIATDGTVLRSFDLRDYGVLQPVGIGSGQGKLFVADELYGFEGPGVPDGGGIIYIFKSPRPMR